jgi:uncharacterized protein (DUF302 family)
MKVAVTGIWLAFALAQVTAAAHAQAPAPVTAAQSGLVVVESAHPFAETERRLLQAIEAAGLKVAARIDHEANAKSVALQLPPTVVLLFGNPRAGTVLMQHQRSIGIDLPLKMLIWEADGKIKLAYNDPVYLARRHGVADSMPVLAQVSQALQKFAEAATKK